ncbi:MAG TPA: asparagine synthase-related protein [Fibrobacteria bacterium]|nr:asparagine synthase-related protein [Fibrobacteria bacterium]
MGYICAIVNKRPEDRGDAASVAAMLAAAVSGRASAGVSAEAPAVRAHGPAAAGHAGAFGEGSARGLYEDGGLLAVCDGEFYNAADLAPPAGCPADAGEAALLAGLFRKRGEAWFEKVRGVYGAFVWDKAAGKGYAWSDRLGVRSIVVHEDADRIAVATRISSLAALPGFEAGLDHQGIFSYLYMEMIPTPFTLYKSIRKLESGHVLRMAGGKADTAMVWNMRYPPAKLSDQAEMEKRIRSLTLAAVRGQASLGVASAEEAGAFLSGGTDSSVVAGLMSELAPGRVNTFSIGFDEPGYDEMEYARIAARRFKTLAHEYYVTREDVADALPLIVRAFDEPFANSSVIPTYFCALKAREAGVKVMLGGDGGDEIFGGNTRYSDNYRNFSRFPAPVEWAMKLAVAVTPPGARKGPLLKAANYLSRKDAPLHKRIHAYDLSYYLGGAEGIFAPGFLERGGPFLRPHEVAERILSKAEAADELDRYMYHDLKNTLMDNDLRKVNTVTELAGVRVRYPFLDADVVEFTGLIPPDLKVREGALRYLYKQAFKDFLPLEIINKKKHGFGLPVVRWMLREGRLHDMLRDALFNGTLRARGIFREGFVEGLYKRSREDKTTYFGSYLYYIFFLELWMREHLDKAGSRPAPAAAATLSPAR